MDTDGEINLIRPDGTVVKTLAVNVSCSSSEQQIYLSIVESGTYEVSLICKGFDTVNSGEILITCY